MSTNNFKAKMATEDEKKKGRNEQKGGKKEGLGVLGGWELEITHLKDRW